MNGMIICEGSTDAVLLQYYFRKAHQWEDVREYSPMESQFKAFRRLRKEG